VLKDEKNKKAHSKSSHMASEAAGSIRTVASLTREEDCLRIYQKALEIPLHNSNRSAIRSNLLYAVTQALSFFVIALVFYVGATWIADGVYPINAFFTVLNSVVFASIQAGNVFNFVPDASKAKSSATSILKQIDMRPEIDAESTEGKMVDGATLQGNIAFDKVHFRYPTRPSVRVLRDLNLNIPAGSFVAFCGASGCGKSTTIGLLERFYDVLAGQVTLDGVPINELNVASFRSHIALVGQEPTLYGGTIRFNIL
jgi:ATP-binding cassette subfamily B (MDR/TAP) protein 1